MTPINIRRCTSILFVLAFPVLWGLLARAFNFSYLGIIADAEAIGLRSTLQIVHRRSHYIFGTSLFSLRERNCADCKSREAKTDQNGEFAEL